MNIDIEKYLSAKNFRVFFPDTLFPPTFEALEQMRCPLCNLKLKCPIKNRKIVFCPSKKHKRFIITKAKFDEIVKNVS